VPAPDLLAGHIVAGRYTVVGAMGARGAAARVTTYEAVSAPNRQVVVKLYDPALAPRTLATLHAAEAVTRDLPRGSTLEVLEVGIDGGSGAPMVVTERSAKPSLAHLVQLCPLSPAEAATLARNLARALAPAHERGLPHLGLKPTNVFVGPAPACDVQLADFGSTVARAAPGGAAVDPADLPWLAPEQVLGGAAPGVASDVFSAALVVFFALTGKPFWRSAAGPVDAAVWSREALGPRAAAWTRAAELGQTLRSEWDTPFLWALDVDPSRRPRSIAELADAFERAARGEHIEIPAPSSAVSFAAPVAAAPALAAPPVREQAPTFLIPRRSKARWILGGAAGLLVALGVAIAGIKLASRTTRAATPPTASTAPAAIASSIPTAAASSAVPPAPTPPSAQPAASSPPPSAPSAEPTAPPGRALLIVSCNPTCDSVWVDGHPAPDTTVGRPMPPGVHQVGANLARHPSKIQAVLLRRNAVVRLDVDFTH
jgi:hypothetical protein